MKKIFQAAAVTLFAASTAQAQQAVQWKVSDGGNGHWYLLAVNGKRSWTDARTWAMSIGGHLATFQTQAEWNVIWQKFDGSNGYWIGLFQDPPTGLPPDQGWRWVTNEPLDFTAWGVEEPNDWIGYQQWVAQAGNAYWDDTIETGLQVPVVEWDADCNGDGIVDYGQCRDGTLSDYNGNNIPDCCERSEAGVVGNYPVQWRADGGGNGHWYQARQCDCCFAQAAAIATSIGGQLASIDEAGEQSRVVIVVPSTRAAKLGGFREPAADQYVGWQWLSGRPFNPAFISWADGNPGCCGDDQYWLFLQATPGGGFGLHDGFNCAWPGSDFMLIEWDADCNNDGVVDYGQILQGQLADLNTDGVPDICQQPICADADLFRDFNVNGADLGILLSQWGPNTPLTVSDINGDGVVSGVDLGLLLSFWGPCPN
jgi:hypothetical protein